MSPPPPKEINSSKRGRKNKSLAEQGKRRENMKVKNRNVMQQMAGRNCIHNSLCRKGDKNENFSEEY
jgi:hypothetical protein